MTTHSPMATGFTAGVQHILGPHPPSRQQVLFICPEMTPFDRPPSSKPTPLLLPSFPCQFFRQKISESVYPPFEIKPVLRAQRFLTADQVQFCQG